MDVVYHIWEVVPIEDITVKVLHLSHACQLELDEYCFEVLVGTTVAEIKEKLLDVYFRRFCWLADDEVAREE